MGCDGGVIENVNEKIVSSTWLAIGIVSCSLTEIRSIELVGGQESEPALALPSSPPTINLLRASFDDSLFLGTSRFRS